jgi:xanthine dehydrogenase small subunit
MVYLSRVRDLHDVNFVDGRLEVGALVSYSDAGAAIAEHIPELWPLWLRIGGEQVRNAGTIGGNIANGSPIGDTPPPLIALGASITLRRGEARRSLPLEDFFIEYGRQDRRPGEFLERISVPLPTEGDEFAAYKISKRHDEDISSLLGAFRLRLVEGAVAEIVIAYGGMAGTPKRARTVEAFLRHKPWTRRTVEDAMELYAEDFRPLSDWRASAAYRLLVARNLLLRFWSETTGTAERHVRELVDG